MLVKILERIIEIMNQKGIKPRELTDYLNLNQQQFTNWKNGSSKSYLKYMAQIAERLDTPINYLYGLDDVLNNDTPTVDFELSTEEKELLNIYHNLNEDKRKKIMSYIIKILLDD